MGSELTDPRHVHNSFARNIAVLPGFSDTLDIPAGGVVGVLNVQNGVAALVVEGADAVLHGLRAGALGDVEEGCAARCGLAKALGVLLAGAFVVITGGARAADAVAGVVEAFGCAPTDIEAHLIGVTPHLVCFFRLLQAFTAGGSFGPAFHLGAGGGFCTVRFGSAISVAACYTNTITIFISVAQSTRFTNDGHFFIGYDFANRTDGSRFLAVRVNAGSLELADILSRDGVVEAELTPGRDDLARTLGGGRPDTNANKPAHTVVSARLARHHAATAGHRGLHGLAGASVDAKERFGARA